MRLRRSTAIVATVYAIQTGCAGSDKPATPTVEFELELVTGSGFTHSESVVTYDHYLMDLAAVPGECVASHHVEYGTLDPRERPRVLLSMFWDEQGAESTILGDEYGDYLAVLITLEGEERIRLQPQSVEVVDQTDGQWWLRLHDGYECVESTRECTPVVGPTDLWLKGSSTSDRRSFTPAEPTWLSPSGEVLCIR